MTKQEWDITAKGLAEHVNGFRLFIDRGAISISFEREKPAHRDDGEALERLPLVIGVFGNDHQEGPAAEREIDLVRAGLAGAGLDELAFDISDDGASWAMLVGEDSSPWKTQVGKTLRQELLKGFLEELVWNAWSNARVCDRLPSFTTRA